MKLLQVFRLVPLLLLIFICCSQGLRLRRADVNLSAHADDNDDESAQQHANNVRNPHTSNAVDDDDDNDNNNDNDDDGDNDGQHQDDSDDDSALSSTKSPGIVSIKSRVIAMDAQLCKERSRYHPHFPRCHEYCTRQNQWMGMCRSDSCHCFS